MSNLKCTYARFIIMDIEINKEKKISNADY